MQVVNSCTLARSGREIKGLCCEHPDYLPALGFDVYQHNDPFGALGEVKTNIC